MFKTSRKPSMSHGKSRRRTTMVSGGCVVYCLKFTSRIKDYGFQINRLLQTKVVRRKMQAKEGEECKMYGLQR